ncbi:MAG: hypothetical protein K0U44_03250 [Actinomycetia bacterium]|nr:hypothetical protein [Actinomycetes bacterium]NKB92585.1 hypothetical protein [Candidatus Nanopelagicales bacterium]
MPAWPSGNCGDEDQQQMTGRAILVAYLHSETKPDSVLEDQPRPSSEPHLNGDVGEEEDNHQREDALQR